MVSPPPPPPLSSIVSGTNLSARFSSTLDDRAHLRSGVFGQKGHFPILASKSVDLSISVCRRPSSALSFLLLSLRLTSLNSPPHVRTNDVSDLVLVCDSMMRRSLASFSSVRQLLTRFTKQVSGKIDRQMSTGRLRSVKLARLHAGGGMRDESRTLDFRLKFSTYRKRRAGEPAVHPRCECN